VTMQWWIDLWLNESFATYFATLWTEHDKGWDEAAWDRHEEANSYLGEDARYRRSIVSFRYTSPMDVFDRHAYPKGGRVLHMLRHELGDERYRAQNDAYRDSGRLLSASRDAEVKVQTLEAVCERYAERLPAGAADEWLRALREERDRAVDALGEDGGAALDQALATVEAGRAQIDSWPLEREDWKLVGPGISRAYKRGRKRMRRVADDPDPEAIHEWRKRVKDLWYHLRVLAVATPEGLADRVEIADRLADALGDHHDLAVLRDDLLLRELPTVKRAALVGAIADRQEELLAEALPLGERLYDRKPKRFRKKMRSGWRDWRRS